MSYNRTGGIASRVSALCKCEAHHRTDAMQSIDMGGPLDAPEWMPAGSVDNITWYDSMGEPIARQTEIDR